MKIEIGVKGRGIVITTVRKEEEKLSAQYRAGFDFAKKLYTDITRDQEEIEKKIIFCGDIATEKSKGDNEEYEANYYAGARDALKWILGEIEEI